MDIRLLIRWTRTVAAVTVFTAVAAGSLASADARPRRKQKPSPIRTALAPLLLARSIVHTVARPLVVTAPRAVLSAATAPMRAARHHRDESFDEDDRPDEETFVAPVAPSRVARIAGRVPDDEPVRVAYLAPRRQEILPPAPDTEDDYERDELVPESPGVAGGRAVLRRGAAQAPANAPAAVKAAIRAGNAIRNKPYAWGGGHRSFNDRGYDCSGALSYALHHAGLLATPMPSSGFRNFGERGRGRWITIYSRPGHAFAVIAGLRFDTTDFRRGGNTGPRWHVEPRDTRGFVARHPAGL